MKTNSLSAWILAVRPNSLGNSVILVLIGSALAWTDRGFHWLPAVLCLAFALLMQCTANLVNDLWDFLKGADQPDRLGPDRAFAKGYITLRAMKSGIAAFTLAACAAGAGLLALSGWNWWLLLVGASCIVFAYFYTAGPWPLAYHGLGDAAVVHHQDLVGVLDGGQTVGDGDDGLAPRQGGDGLLDQVLVLRVDAGGGLVQNGVRHGVGRAGGQAEQHHLGGIGCQRQQAPLHRQRRRGRSRIRQMSRYIQ